MAIGQLNQGGIRVGDTDIAGLVINADPAFLQVAVGIGAVPLAQPLQKA